MEGLMKALEECLNTTTKLTSPVNTNTSVQKKVFMQKPQIEEISRTMKLLFLLTVMLTSVSWLEASTLRKKYESPSVHSNKNSAKTGNCYTGNGKDYRGTTAVTESGQSCLRWDHLSKSLWSHNYCRNPDSSIKPWCFIQTKYFARREFCNIPSCPMEPKSKASTCGERTQKQFKIVGGSVTTVESQPWIASIFKRFGRSNGFQCGGSLISPCWVLTAAHCFPDGIHTNAKKYFVFLGKNAINETDYQREKKFSVEEIIIHEAYKDSDQMYNNDIALLKIQDIQGQCAHESNAIRTVCLPPPNMMLPPGTYCQIAGYGRVAEGSGFSQYLKETTVQVLSQRTCAKKKYYGTLLTDNMFCAGSTEWDTDSCKGDSGGPLVCEVDRHMFLFGIISWGEGCSREFRPGVYTRVTNYNQWIEDKTRMPGIASGSMFPEK
ncbi:urokinase-type plasminogen activator-like [Arapaima gigas]